MKQTTASNSPLMSPQEYFSTLQSPKTPRSSFDRSCEILTTMNAGGLYPIFWDEVLPASTWNVSTSLFGRINTLIKPLMDNLYIDLHWFFIPNRLVWSHWVNFMGEQVDPTAPITYTIPQMSFPVGITPNGVDLASYLGLPYGLQGQTVSSLPFRAYKKIYDDYYRDENLIATKLPYSGIGDTTDVYDYGNWALYRRARRKDYFTSALPWAQKGTAPTMTLGTSAPVLGIGKIDQTYAGSNITAYEANGASTTYTHPAYIDHASGANYRFVVDGTADTLGYPNIRADLSAATGFTLNAFREFVTIQQYLELDARGGTRYVETLHSQFGVQPEDARLQRVEYLGGQTIDLVTTPITQTSESGTTAQGNLAGMGTFASNGGHFVKSFTEDGIIMCIASSRSENRYQQGIQKKWSRTSRYDFYRPVFANLGEQPIYNKELFASNSSADDQIFGYQEAWAEYRYSQSLITGVMNSDVPLSLDVWHIGMDYASLPTLGQTFIEENPPIDRVVAVVSAFEPAFTINGRFNLNVAQPMPTRSIPGLTRL